MSEQASVSEWASERVWVSDVSSNSIKEIYNEIKIPFLDILQKSIKTGVFPDELKIAKVITVFTTGEGSNLNNYRPISILPTSLKYYNLGHLLVDICEIWKKNAFSRTCQKCYNHGQK